MSIEHYPDPCGPECIAKGLITDTMDGREHDNCPDPDVDEFEEYVQNGTEMSRLLTHEESIWVYKNLK